jgi:isopenicillin N synthase-like dioxygenase
MSVIPIIDNTTLASASTLATLHSACSDWGAFQLVNHGISTASTDDLARQMQAFFGLPHADKRRIARTAHNPWGFYDQELTKNTRDWKQIFDYGQGGAQMPPQWPAQLPAFASAVHSHYVACEQLALRLLAAIADNLGAPAARLQGHFRGDHSSYLRLNYYPECPPTEQGQFGVNQHTDAGALTLLLQDRQAGLEVLKDDSWVLVEPVAGALTINLGDIVQVWSNDRYRAPLHRVRTNATAKRYSAPFFFNPTYATDYQPLPATVDADHPPRYRSINWGEFRDRRAHGDYADYGEEVQIAQYRI